MDQAITYNIAGIKCDNPECDFIDMTIQVENYKDWVNVPCPKCGAILLTEADYENTMTIIEAVNIMNGLFPAPAADEPIVTAQVKMDGSGKMDFIINEQ